MNWVTHESAEYLFDIGLMVFFSSLGLLTLLLWNTRRLERIIKNELSNNGNDKHEDQ